MKNGISLPHYQQATNTKLLTLYILKPDKLKFYNSYAILRKKILRQNK